VQPDPNKYVESAEALARQFFAALSAGSVERLASLTSGGFTWLNRPVKEGEWGLLARWAAAAPTEVSEVRALAASVFELLPAEVRDGVFGGPIPESAEVLIADVLRDCVSVTIGIVIDRGLVLRLFDPIPLRRAFLDLATEQPSRET
jgi:hypothetical protein